MIVNDLCSVWILWLNSVDWVLLIVLGRLLYALWFIRIYEFSVCLVNVMVLLFWLVGYFV